MKSSTPATQALNKKLLESQDSHSALGGDNQLVGRRQVSVKRSSSQMLGSMLDMTSLLEASEEIEGCPSFPNIEWPTLDHNNQDATDLCAPQGKRRCSGLSRCKKAFHNLSPSISTRTGSCGSIY